MYRLFTFFFLITSFLHSQTAAARLQELAHKLPHNGREFSSARFADGLDEIRADLEEIEKQPMNQAASSVLEERHKLGLLDQAYAAEFARIEATLRGAGLSKQDLDQRLARWRNFTAHYRGRMDASLAALERLGHGHPTRSEIAALRAGLGARTSIPTDAVMGPMDRPPAPFLAGQTEAIRPKASDQPTPDDLAETTIVKLSPDIRALAASLGNSPSALYAYVHNNISYVPYFMLMLNSEAVLWAGRGNDADQATLLIALLRAAGVPARYVTADIDIPVADAANWVGAKDRDGAAHILSAATAFTDNGDHFSIQHTWVQGWVDKGDGNGPNWVDMDPGLKRQTFQPGLMLPIPTFDRAKFLSAPSPRLSTEIYGDQIHAAFLQRFPGHDFSELAYKGTIVPADPNTLPTLAYAPTRVLRQTGVQPANALWRATVTIAGATNSNVLLKQDVVIPEICLQSLAVTFAPATTADQNVIDRFGGLGKVPAGMVNLLAQFRLDENVIATSAVSVPNLANLTITVAETGPNDAKPRFTQTHAATAGWNIVLNIVTPANGDTLIGSRIDSLLSSLPTASQDQSERATLALAALLFYQKKEQHEQDVYVPLQYLPVLDAPFEAMTEAAPLITNLFDRPFLAVGSTMLIDEELDAHFNADLNLSAARDRTSVAQAYSVAESQTEEQLWEQLVLIPSLCTISVIQNASQQGIKINVFNSTNAAPILASLPKLSANALEVLNSELKDGDTITMPAQLVTIGAFKGIAWIADAANGVSFFRIDNIGGGTTGGNSAGPMPPTKFPGPTGNNGVTGGTNQGDPVSVSNGNLFQQQTDLAISGRGPAIMIQRTYNSLLAANDGPFGFGWTYSYNFSLQDNQTAVTFINSSGGSFTFSLQNGVYVSQSGANLALTKDSNGFLLRNQDGTRWRFNAGKLQSVIDRNGNTVQLTYDGSSRLMRVVDAVGRTLDVSYDGQNHITGVRDFSGRQVRYTYDVAGNLASVTDPAGNTTNYTYATDNIFNHALRTVTTPSGKSTTFEYYANRQVAAITGADGRTMRFLYMPLHNETLFIDDRGFVTAYYYNSAGNVTRAVDAAGNVTDTAYTPALKPMSITDANGNVTSYTYDAAGNLAAITDPLGATVRMTYEPQFNQVSSVTDARGAVTQFQYDANGNRTQVNAPLGVQFRFTYDSFGDLSTVIDGDGNQWSLAYDSSGNLSGMSDPLGNTSTFQFDSLSRLIGCADALNNLSRVGWDGLDRISTRTDPLGNTSTIAYDPNGNISQTTDPNGGTARYAYDVIDNLTTVTDSLGGNTKYNSKASDCLTCTAGPNVTSYIDPSGRAQQFQYDYRNKVTQSSDALGNTTRFAYNGRGLLATKTDGNGAVTSFQYDAKGRVVQKSYSDGTTSSYAYDADGNMISASNANSTLTFTYDALNRMTSVTDARFPKTIQYTYDNNGRRTSLTDSEGGTFTYTYDKAARLIAVGNPSGSTAQFTYDAAARPIALVYSNGTQETMQYDSAGRVASLSWGSIAGFQYTYDSNGNPVSVTDLTGTHMYQYDALNRLNTAVHPVANPETYSYDPAGNRTASATDANYVYDASGRLVSAESATYSYDNNGNLVVRTDSNGMTTYTYDIENRLAGIVFPDGTAASYKYDALGRRIEKNVNGNVTRYLYDGPHILLEFDGNNQFQARYTYSAEIDKPLMMERGGATYFYHADRLGSIAAVTDTSGNTVCSYSYDSFGRGSACQSLVTPFGFDGRELDPESGLYYMRARYYNPILGQFTSSDPLDFTGLLLAGTGGGLPWVPQQLNHYSYASNSPLQQKDPSGLKGTGPTPPPQQFCMGISGTSGGAAGGPIVLTSLNPIYPGLNGDPGMLVLSGLDTGNYTRSTATPGGPAELAGVLFVPVVLVTSPFWIEGAATLGLAGLGAGGAETVAVTGTTSVVAGGSSVEGAAIANLYVAGTLPLTGGTISSLVTPAAVDAYVSSSVAESTLGAANYASWVKYCTGLSQFGVGL